MSTPVSRVVNVSINASPTFPKRGDYSIFNLIGTSDRLPSGDRIRTYASMDEVAADFAAGDQEYLAATKFFSQSPRPKTLMISRRLASGAKPELIGYPRAGTAYSSVSAWTSTTNGAFDLLINGVVYKISGMNFTAAVDMNGVASIIQTAMNAATAAGTPAWTGGTVTWDGSQFILRAGAAAADSTVATAATTATGSPVDIRARMGMSMVSVSTNGIVKATPGIPAETNFSDTLDALQDLNQSWWAFGMAYASAMSSAQILDCSAWAEARTKVFFALTQDPTVPTSSTTDVASQLKALGYRRTLLSYDQDDAYLHVSAASRALSVDFNQRDSALTLKFKMMPGNTPNDLTESARGYLVSKNANYYTNFGDSAMYAEGVMSNGIFFDEVQNLDWLQNAIQTNVFGYLYTRTTKVPQTDKGMAALEQQVELALKQAVYNGILAPGVWNGSDLGEIHTGDFLPKGYYVYAQPVGEQNQSDREARKAPPIQALAKGGGAFHYADISIVFDR